MSYYPQVFSGGKKKNFPVVEHFLMYYLNTSLNKSFLNSKHKFRKVNIAVKCIFEKSK